MSILVSIYLASLSNATVICAAKVWNTPKLHFFHHEVEDFLPQALSAGTIFRLHPCGTDADCACVSINYGQLATLQRHAWPQYSQAGDDILTILIANQYYRSTNCLCLFIIY